MGEMSPPAKLKKTVKVPKKISASYLENSGLYYLQRFPSSVANFRRVMRMKIKKSITHHKTPTFDEAHDWLEELITRLCDLGYLNDPAYAKGLTRSLKNRGSSKAKIAAKLYEKGIPEELKNPLLETIDGTAEKRAALTYLQKKRKGPFAKDAEDYEAQQKTLGGLARQGFSYEISASVLEMDASQAEAYLENTYQFSDDFLNT